MSEPLLGFAPLWLLLFGALALLLADAFAQRREPGFLRGLALLIIGAALLSAGARLGAPELDLGGFALSGALVFDHLTAFCDVIALLSLAGIVAFARERGRVASRSGAALAEREPLLLLAGFGALTIIHAGDLVVLWLGVELLAMSAALTMLAAHESVADATRRDALLVQLLPGVVVACLSLLGIAMIYAGLGTTSLDGFARAATRVFAQWGGTQRWVLLTERYGAELAQQDPAALQQAHGEIVRGLAPAAMFLPGVLLLLGGLLTRLGLLPFARRRELAESAPLHVVALWSSLAVVALLAALLRVYAGALHSPRLVNEPYGWTGALPSVALLTGVWAAITALRQRRLARVVSLLAIVQVSMLLLGVVAGAGFHGHIGAGARLVAPESEILWARMAGDEAFASVLALLAAHTIAVVGCFAALAASRGAQGPDVRMQHWAGMATRRPALALAFALCLCSLVGLPPLAGFVGKLGVVRAIVEHSALRWMLLVLVFELAVSAWIALRIIAAMLFGDAQASEPGERPSPGAWPARVAGLAAALGVLVGLAGQRLLVLVRLPAAAVSFEPGDPDRLDWLEQRREHWAAEDARVFEVETVTASEDADDVADADTELRSVAPAEG